MDYIIENGFLKVVVSSRGAEVQNVIDIKSGIEHWWQGDEHFWNGRSPILFPACGGLWNGEYSYKGVSYNMPKHGFVRQMDWQLVSQDSDSLILSVSSSDSTLLCFPFRFVLSVRYKLTDNSLRCEYSISNESVDDPMYYQIGGHPAIALPDYSENGITNVGFIQPLISGEPVRVSSLSVVRASEQGCWSNHRYSVPEQNGLIPISEFTFSNEALIFDSNQIDGCRILRADGETSLAEVRSSSPVWLFWQPQGLLSPFICAEPWYGLCDKIGASVELSKRPYIQTLNRNSKYNGLLWSVSF